MSTPTGPSDPYASPGGSEPQQPPTYGQPPAYGAQPPAYGAQPPAYGAQPPSYGGGYPGGGYPGGGGYGGYGPGGFDPGPPPESYLVWAILATVLCCLPLGIPAIVFATQVNSKWMAGDFAGAHDASRKAKLFTIWSAVIGVVAVVLYVVGILAWGWSFSATSGYNF